MALGALIIKEKLGISDRETVEQIKENPYLQYFIGLSDAIY
ncbi:transposase (fragment) [Planktothrix paucivesiculata PCC 9631]